ncbi:Uncharacterised protein [Bordetella pertussis]|nr:Uncharacterised protein [Bordetella pertussis]
MGIGSAIDIGAPWAARNNPSPPCSNLQFPRNWLQSSPKKHN